MLLAGLISRADQPVSSDFLTAVLWSHRPPVSARSNLQSYVHQLRLQLGAERLLRKPEGYLLVTHGEVDAAQFRKLAAEGTAAFDRRSHESAGRCFRRALDLWRGPAFAEFLDSEPLAEEALSLEQLRLTVYERWAENELALGRHAEALAELREVARAHPYQESLHAHLMLALYRSGRQTEALETYAAVRDLLGDELGIEPSPMLRRVHEAILRGDDRVDLSARSGAWPPAGGTVVPRQLPPTIADFTGRDEEVATLRDALSPDWHQAPTICAISGMGGVGKTALALHVAHQLADAFPDGQLYVGFSGTVDRIAVGRALESMLRVLGVDGSTVPGSIDDRTALFRSLLAGKRMLIVIDNVTDESQVVPLLPGSGSCGVLITGRPRLTGLAGVRHLHLDVFRPAQAIELLARITGSDQVWAAPGEAAEIVRLCDHLPLAVRAAGARLASRPDWPLSRVADLLRDERRRLDELAVGDLTVRASLGLSYTALSPSARRLYCLLSELYAPDFAGWVAAAVLDASLEEAERRLGELLSANLLTFAGTDATGQSRYRFHDLIRLHARDRAEAEASPQEIHAAMSRALGGWLVLARRADTRLPGRVFPTLPAEGVTHEPHVEISDAWAWFEAERGALRASVAQAAALGADELCWQLADAAVNFFELRDYYDDWESTSRLALDACERAGNARGRAFMLRDLAECLRMGPRHAEEEALEHGLSAVALFESLGEVNGEADARILAGMAFLVRGEPRKAVAYLDAALAKAREAGYVLGQVEAEWQLGYGHWIQGDIERATVHLEAGLRLAEDVPLLSQLCRIHTLLGIVRREEGGLVEAEAHFTRGVELARSLRSRSSEITILPHLGMTYVKLGDSRGRHVLDRSLRAARRWGARFQEAMSLSALGELEQAEGRHALAVAHTAAAVEIWRELASPFHEGQALKSLGALHATTDPDQARTAWSAARRLFVQLDNHAEVKELTALLETVGGDAEGVRR
ncbi:BTAD domain-containing putative transcriptional regulator [Nonomuraea sp. MCN248]|uniref:BTAD domain-containing putative transcriptional regulator n=2 Tax=Nonomuraea corallina TaxID=2989783 RepID=A0ABT4S557_9ACTN|nr:BTAD domain-containing putative transcriptional regulator [Nonomuraea corallina]MDA0632333.1 BTAD domain-containing putative transcriptional regulator [Nonomuraea corallina]